MMSNNFGTSKECQQFSIHANFENQKACHLIFCTNWGDLNKLLLKSQNKNCKYEDGLIFHAI